LRRPDTWANGGTELKGTNMNLIYGELHDGNGRIEKGVYTSYIEAALADRQARLNCGKLTGGLKLCIALNRYRGGRCMNCGCTVGENHRHGCNVETVLEAEGVQRRCENCLELPDDGTCDKCGDSILTTRDAWTHKAEGK
jgi:hypothetical protein